MTTVQQLTPEEFRRQLAGLADERSSNVFDNDELRPLAVDFAIALALAFNRAQLDAITLWTRIDSAIESGVTAANGADIHRLIDVACGHVLAKPNAVVTDEFQSRIAPALALDPDAAYAFCAYLGKSRYTTIALAKQAWDERRELRKLAEQLAAEEAANESEVTE